MEKEIEYTITKIEESGKIFYSKKAIKIYTDKISSDSQKTLDENTLFLIIGLDAEGKEVKMLDISNNRIVWTAYYHSLFINRLIYLEE